MSIFTAFLRLFQYDRAQDADSTFNVDLALNQNWDKIDLAVSELDTGKADAAHTHAAADIGADLAGAAQVVQGNLQMHMADSARHVSSAERTAWNGKANAMHEHTKAQVGLGNADNTADNQKSVKHAATASYADTAGNANAVGGVAASNVFSTTFKPYVVGTFAREGDSTQDIHVVLGFRPSAVFARAAVFRQSSSVGGTVTAANFLALDGSPILFDGSDNIVLEIVSDGFNANAITANPHGNYIAFR